MGIRRPWWLVPSCELRTSRIRVKEHPSCLSKRLLSLTHLVAGDMARIDQKGNLFYADVRYPNSRVQEDSNLARTTTTFDCSVNVEHEWRNVRRAE